ncbi:EAL and HDOD domain-containing protein [Desulfuromonas thiophila]|uniref:EAL and HDOD domain-containing protein n=1 Tax=Desulfuromonas thiophila TaxID=57664 RepID=UPI0024A8BF68|nr:HDOD domain-containing protein [Desulfuromonas thiophila]
MRDIFIGRQPIFDRQLRVYAYELLYRHARDMDRAVIADVEAASSEVVINSLVEVGLDRLVGAHKAFCNFTRGFLLQGASLPFATSQLVVEVLETVSPEPVVLEAIRRLARGGHIIALDDFVLSEGLAPLVELADIVKIDILALSRAQIASQVHRLRKIKAVKLLAEKVESYDDYIYCRRLGFDYFQGFFFSRPQVVAGRKLPPSRMAMLRLMTELQRPDIDLETLQQIIETDVHLSVKLLRQINSSYYSLVSEVRSIRQAIVYLGLQHIRNWACIVAIGSVDEKPRELMTMSLVRAKMCELLSDQDSNDRRGVFFTVGLFSLLDSLLDVPMAEVLQHLPLAAEVRAALLQREGVLGQTLRLVEDYEQGRWDRLERGGRKERQVAESYLVALDWSRTALESLS